MAIFIDFLLKETLTKKRHGVLPTDGWCRSLSTAISNRLPKTQDSRSHAKSRRGASHDLAAARAISAAASATPLFPPRPAWASKIFATCHINTINFIFWLLPKFYLL